MNKKGYEEVKEAVCNLIDANELTGEYIGQLMSSLIGGYVIPTYVVGYIESDDPFTITRHYVKEICFSKKKAEEMVEKSGDRYEVSEWLY